MRLGQEAEGRRQEAGGRKQEAGGRRQKAGANNQIFVMNADGSGLAPLITQNQSMQPAWSPDGTKITFVSENSLYVANSDGTGITKIGGGGIYNFKPDWQPLAGTPTIELSANNYNISEAGGRLPIAVTRSSSAGAATVNYATSDNAALNSCSSVTTLASSRCDYATTVGTLRFAAGDVSKTIYIPIVDDAYADGLETFTIKLSNPTGATLGARVTGTITIQDDSLPGSNPITSNSFFVRQHYIDFLGREPEPQGLTDWQNILTNCGTTVARPCDRIEVSSAFFRSPEFQSRGYFIYRFYSSAGEIPLYPDFMPDLAKVSGFLSEQELEANKAAFVTEFMGRAKFQSKYSATFSNPTAYVNALLQTVGLPNHPSRQTWINNLTSNNNATTRGQVLRSLVESNEVYQKYYNEAFVIMQYFGYLRRTADASYVQWIQTMNQTNGDYRTMIDGFLNSLEYRQRFGP